MSFGFLLIRGSALGPIGGLSARQFNSCLPRREEVYIVLGTCIGPVLRPQHKAASAACQYGKKERKERMATRNNNPKTYIFNCSRNSLPQKFGICSDKTSTNKHSVLTTFTSHSISGIARGLRAAPGGTCQGLQMGEKLFLKYTCKIRLYQFLLGYKKNVSYR